MENNWCQVILRFVTTIFLAMFMFGALSPFNPVMCYGADGHEALEMAPCGVEDTHAQHTGDSQQIHGDCCGPCRDIPFLSDASVLSTGAGRNTLLWAKRIAPVSHLYSDKDSCVAVATQRRCSEFAAYSNQEILALRTIRLLI